MQPCLIRDKEAAPGETLKCEETQGHGQSSWLLAGRQRMSGNFSEINLKIKWNSLGGFPGSSDGKESTCNAGDLVLIPGLGRSPGGGHANPLQYSCLENVMDRGAWRATVYGVSKGQTQLTLSTTQHTGSTLTW